MALSISPSLPIKLWLNGEEVFNQKLEPGIIGKSKFLQKVETGDEIRLQLKDENYKDYRVQLLDHEDDLVDEFVFTKVLMEDEGVYLHSVLFSFTGKPNGIYSLSIVDVENRIAAVTTGLLGTVAGELSLAVIGFSIEGTVSGLLGTVESELDFNGGVLSWSLLSGTASNGRLIINVNTVEIVNEVTGLSSNSGSFALNNGDDVEIINTWLSGSGNESRCRACSLNLGELDYTIASLALGSPKSTAFTFNLATHGNITVSLRSGGLTPAICPIP